MNFRDYKDYIVHSRRIVNQTLDREYAHTTVNHKLLLNIIIKQLQISTSPLLPACLQEPVDI